MKTVLLLKSDYVRTGGPETLLRGLAMTIDRERFDPVLGIMRKPGEAPLSQYPDCLRQIELPWRGIGAVLATARRVAAIARVIDAAVVHSHDMRADAVAASMRLFHRLPWIAHVHGWLGPTHSGRWRAYEAVDRRLVRIADHVLVGSGAARDEVRGCGVKHVEIVPNAVAIPGADALNTDTTSVRAELGLPGDALILGMLGRLHVGKGHEIFLRALATLRGGGVNAHGLIVGEGPEGDELRALTRTLGIAGHVTFTGFVEDTNRALTVMDVVAVPSLKDSLPLTALEAMALARPIVASAAGDLPVAIEDGVSGFIVPIGDPGAFAERLMVLAGDPALRRRMGAAGRARAIRMFSAEAMARRLEDQYEAVIAECAKRAA